MDDRIQYKGRYDLEGIILIPILTGFVTWVVLIITSSVFISSLVVLVGLAALLFDLKKIDISDGKIKVIRPWKTDEIDLNQLRQLTFYFKGELRFMRPLILFDLQGGRRFKIKETRQKVVDKLMTDLENSEFDVKTKKEIK